MMRDNRMEYAHYTLDQRPEFAAVLPDLHAAAWPPFMLEDSVANQYWHHLYDDFPAYQHMV